MSSSSASSNTAVLVLVDRLTTTTSSMDASQAMEGIMGELNVPDPSSAALVLLKSDEFWTLVCQLWNGSATPWQRERTGGTDTLGSEDVVLALLQSLDRPMATDGTNNNNKQRVKLLQNLLDRVPHEGAIVHALLDLLCPSDDGESTEEVSLSARITAMDILRALGRLVPSTTQRHLLSTPGGFHRIVSSLLVADDSAEEAIRNDFCRFATDLANANANFARLLLFGDAYETALRIAVTEFASSSATKVVAVDAIQLCVALTRADVAAAGEYLFMAATMAAVWQPLAQLLDLRQGRAYRQPAAAVSSTSPEEEENLDDLLHDSSSGKASSRGAKKRSTPRPHLLPSEEDVISGVLELLGALVATQTSGDDSDDAKWASRCLSLLTTKPMVYRALVDLALFTDPPPEATSFPCAIPSVSLRLEALHVAAALLAGVRDDDAKDKALTGETQAPLLERLMYFICTGGTTAPLEGEGPVEQRLRPVSLGALAMFRACLSPHTASLLVLHTLAPPPPPPDQDDEDANAAAKSLEPQAVQKLVNTLSENVPLVWEHPSNDDFIWAQCRRVNVLGAAGAVGVLLTTAGETACEMMLKVGVAGANNAATTVLDVVLHYLEKVAQESSQKEDVFSNALEASSQKHKEIRDDVTCCLLRLLTEWISSSSLIVLEAVLSHPSSVSLGPLVVSSRSRPFRPLAALLLGLAMNLFPSSAEDKDWGGWSRTSLANVILHQGLGVSRFLALLEEYKRVSGMDKKRRSQTLDFVVYWHCGSPAEAASFAKWLGLQVNVVRRAAVQQLAMMGDSEEDDDEAGEADKETTQKTTTAATTPKSQKSMAQLVARQDEELMQLRQELDQSRQEVVQQQKELTLWKRRVVETPVEELLTEKMGETQELSRQVAQLQEALDQSKKEISETNQTHQDALQKVQEELTSAQTVTTDMEGEKVRLEGELQGLADAYASLERDFHQSKQDAATATAAAASATTAEQTNTPSEKEMAELHKLRQDVRAANDWMAMAVKRMEDNDRQGKEWEATNAASRTELQQLQTQVQSERANWQSEKEAWQAEREALQAQVTELQQQQPKDHPEEEANVALLRQEMKSANEWMAMAVKRMEEMETTNNALEAQVQQSQDQATRVRQEANTEWQAIVDDLTDKLEQTQQDRQAQVDKLTMELEDVQEELSRALPMEHDEDRQQQWNLERSALEAQVKDLTRQVQEAAASSKDDQHVAELQSSLDDVQARWQSNETRVAQLQSSLDDVQARWQSNESKVVELQSSLDDVQARWKAAQDEAESLRKANAQAQEWMTNAVAHHDTLVQQVEELTRVNESLTAAAESSNDFKSALAAKTAARPSLVQRASSVTQAADFFATTPGSTADTPAAAAAAAAAATTTSPADGPATPREELEQEVQSLRQEVVELRMANSEVDQLKQEVVQLRMSATANEQESDEVQSLRQEVVQLRMSAASANENEQSLRQEVVQLRLTADEKDQSLRQETEAAEDLRRSIESLRAEKEEAQRRMADLEAAQSQEEESRRRSSSQMVDRVAALEQELKASEEHNEDLLGRVVALDDLQLQLEERTDMVTQLEGDVNRLHGEMERLQDASQLDEWKNRAEKGEGRVKELEEELSRQREEALHVTSQWEQHSHTLEQRSTELETQLVAATTERDALSLQLSTLTEERDSLSVQQSTLVEERDSLSLQLSNLTEERNSLSSQLSTVAEERQDVESKCHVLEGELNRVRSELDNVQMRLTETNASLENKVSDFASLEEETEVKISCLQAELECKDASLKSRQDDLAKVKSEAAEQLEALEQLRADNEALTKQFVEEQAQSEQVVNMWKERNEELEANVVELEASLEKQEAEAGAAMEQQREDVRILLEEQEKARLAALELQEKEANSVIEQWEASCNTLTETVEKLDKQLMEGGYHAKVLELEKELAARVSYEEDLLQSLEEYRKHIEEQHKAVQTRTREVETLKKETERLEAEREVIKANAAEEMASKDAKLEGSVREASEVSLLLRQKEEALTTLGETKAALDSSLKEAKQEASRIQKKADSETKLRAKLEARLKKQMIAAEKEADGSRRKYEGLLEEARVEKTALEDSMAQEKQNHKEQMQSLESTKSRLLEELSSAKLEIDSEKRVVQQLRHELHLANDSLQSRFTDEVSAKASEAAVEALKVELNDIRVQQAKEEEEKERERQGRAAAELEVRRLKEDLALVVHEVDFDGSADAGVRKLVERASLEMHRRERQEIEELRGALERVMEELSSARARERDAEERATSSRLQSSVSEQERLAAKSDIAFLQQSREEMQEYDVNARASLEYRINALEYDREMLTRQHAEEVNSLRMELSQVNMEKERLAQAHAESEKANAALVMSTSLESTESAEGDASELRKLRLERAQLAAAAAEAGARTERRIREALSAAAASSEAELITERELREAAEASVMDLQQQADELQNLLTKQSAKATGAPLSGQVPGDPSSSTVSELQTEVKKFEAETSRLKGENRDLALKCEKVEADKADAVAALSEKCRRAEAKTRQVEREGHFAAAVAAEIARLRAETTRGASGDGEGNDRALVVSHHQNGHANDEDGGDGQQSARNKAVKQAYDFILELQSAMNEERHLYRDLLSEHEDLLALLAQQDVERTSLQAALERLGGQRAVEDAVREAERLTVDQYGKSIRVQR